MSHHVYIISHHIRMVSKSCTVHELHLLCILRVSCWDPWPGMSCFIHLDAESTSANDHRCFNLYMITNGWHPVSLAAVNTDII